MKKGFTLIELLAVILILGIIALIAVPKITDVIEDSREQANLRSLEGHLHDVENNLAINMLHNAGLKGTYSFNELGFSDFPASDTIRCSSYEIDKSVIISATDCVINNKSYCYIDSKADSCENMGNLDSLVIKRVNEIRSTGNTDISGRTGNIYYVSNDGSDSNSGLSPDTPLKTLAKVNTMLNHNQITENSTILLRDGDTFRTELVNLKQENLLLGSYGDISKGKPIITRSLYDGAKEGVWIEVKPNIWKYQINSTDPFKGDVGVIWFLCNNGNNNCSMSMDTVSRKFDYAKKQLTNLYYDETDIESKIETILTKDLQFYHTGHADSGHRPSTGGALYLYSIGNPKDRFDEIEFAAGGVFYSRMANLAFDNLTFLYIGGLPISTYDMSNISVTNSEFGFIGGVTQGYKDGADEKPEDKGKYVRYGNAIQVYGSIKDIGDSKVKDGFIAKNNYIYQVYDAGVSFQYNSSGVAQMKKAKFIDNVIEYCAYDIEFWEYSSSTDPSVIENSYIGDFLIANNILRYSGYGPSLPRTDINASALIKTWFNENGTYNYIKGDIVIRDNKFSDAKYHFITYFTNMDTYPKIYNNTFYGREDQSFAKLDDQRSAPSIIFDKYLMNEKLSNNRYITIDENIKKYDNDSGKTGSADWSYNSKTYTLSITGSGNMANYSENNLPPWSKYKDRIYSIEIGEDVTKLGKYAFYDLQRVTKIRIDSKNLADLNGEYVKIGESNIYYSTYYTFYQVGLKTTGTTLVFGPEVTRIPKALLIAGSANSTTDNPNITEIIFEGNNVSTVATMSLRQANIRSIRLPEGVTTIGNNAFEGNLKLAFIVYPNNKTDVGSQVIMSQHVEKVVFGPSVDIANGFLRYNSQSTKIVIVAPHIVDPSKYDKVLLNIKSSAVVDIYGDENTEEWVTNIKTVNSKNINYHLLSEYKSTIRSNIGISEDNIPYNGTYEFTTNKDVTIRMYYRTSKGTRCYVDADYTKEGNTYTITNIKSDIYIEAK